MSLRNRAVVAAVAFGLMPGAVSTAASAEPPLQGPGRPRVGLALGGGSARGLAHVGVLKWLEEHRVPVDAIAGASMGAFVGGAYSTGMPAREMQTMLEREDWDGMVAGIPPYSLKSFRRKQDVRDHAIKLELGLRHGLRLQGGLNAGHELGMMLSRVTLPYSTVLDFDELPIPFRCTATDIEAGETVVLARGPMAPALRASMALPGTFDPVLVGERWLSDGGILNNVPADVVKAMGVDVVIAVSVSPTRRDRRVEGLRAVANRAIQLMMAELDKGRLSGADVVLLPDVEGVGSAAFQRTAEIIERGYRAADAHAAELARFSLSPADWKSHLADREARRRPRNSRFTFIEVKGVSPAAGRQIATRLETDLSGGADPERIDANLDWLIGHGQFASAMYRRVDRDGKEGLVVDVREKSYAPPLVRFAIDLDNEDQDINLTFGSRVTLFDVTSLGSEARIDGSVGSTLKIAAELLQPLGGTSSMRRGFFVAPRVGYVRRGENLYDGERVATVYGHQRTTAGLDAGWLFGRDAEFRVGYEMGYLRSSVRVGDDYPAVDGQERAFRASFDFDGRNRAHLASSGTRVQASATWTVKSPWTPEEFGVAEASVTSAVRVSRRQHITLSLDAGADFGGDPPLLHQFGLGGPSRMSAFAPGEFRGPRLLVGGVGYRAELARLPSLLGDRLYLTTRFEVGSVFDRYRSSTRRVSVTAGIASDTIFGPFFVGGSVGTGGAVRAYLVLGRGVR